MKYAVYNSETMIINKITMEEPTEISADELVAKTGVLNLGDEVSQQISIHEIDEAGIIKSYSGYKVAPSVRELLDADRKKDSEIKALKEALSLTQKALDEVLLGGM